MYEFMCTINEVCHNEQLASQEREMDHPKDFIRLRFFLSLAISEPEYLHVLSSFVHQISLVCFDSVKYYFQVWTKQPHRSCSTRLVMHEKIVAH